MIHFGLVDFIRESNRIEGIFRDPTPKEIEAHQQLLHTSLLRVELIEDFVQTVANAPIRDRSGMNVRVGQHIAPPGGPEIREELQELLHKPFNSWQRHVAFQNLHPFMDGNGRAGRALWLRDVGGSAPLGFLHHFYYQTLSNLDKMR